MSDDIERAARARDIAVRVVDAIHGYTMERAPSQAQHRYDYDRAEEIIKSALAHAARGEGHSFTCPFGNAKKRGESPRDACNCGHFEKTHPTPPPATGEAGTRGEVEVGAHAMDVAERCYYAIKGGAPYRDSIRAMAAIIEAERPLPEAREGGGK